jgi:hypothetical protein
VALAFLERRLDDPHPVQLPANEVGVEVVRLEQVVLLGLVDRRVGVVRTYISFLPTSLKSNRSIEPLKMKVSSNVVAPAVPGLGVSWLRSGATLTRRWPGRYVQARRSLVPMSSGSTISSARRRGAPARCRSA